MRTRIVPSLLAALLIAAGVSIAPSPVVASEDRVASAVLQGQSEERGDRDPDHGDDDRGHGNEEDGFDEDNPGQGGGQDEPPVVRTGGYMVEVECDFDDDDITECDISVDDVGDPPEIGRVTVPEAGVCAEVIKGDFVYLGPDSGTNVTGYASEEGDDDLELELRGRVTTSGTQTYWISTIDGVFPAEGLGLQCDQDTAVSIPTATAPSTAPATTATAVSPSPTPTAPQPTSTPAPTTGSLDVVTYTCTGVPEDRTGFDWFGTCEPGADPMTFSLTASGDTAKNEQIQDTDTSGEATFGNLEPGTYQLDAVDASWCHATSDNVTSESGLVVDAGKTTTVWIFLCDDTPRGV